MLALGLKASLIYWATALDLLVMLMVLFKRYPKKASQIILGQYLGSGGLILVCLALAYIFHFVPDESILGFLGFIPILLGIKVLIMGEKEEELDSVEEGKSLILVVATLTFISCGADNIGIFTPFFTNLELSSLIFVLLVFLLNILLLIFIGKTFSKSKWLDRLLDNYGDKLVGTLYILIGLSVLWDTGLLGQIFSSYL